MSSKGNTTIKTQIPHPNLVWIDYVDKRLTFGTVDKRNIILRQIKDLPSLPLSVMHIPTMHSLAKSQSLIGLGLDVSGILGVDQQMYKPFHDLYMNYLQSREKIKKNQLEENNQSSSVTIGSEQNEDK
ncbi:MAG: hypothetical protein EZS28_025676, partial [Streblomastix strix]